MTWKAHSQEQQNFPLSIVLDKNLTPSFWGQVGINPKEEITVLASLQEAFSPAVTPSGWFSLPSLADKGAHVLQKAHNIPGSETQVLQEFLE